MDIDIIDEIVKCTNNYMQGIWHKFARERRCIETSRNEIMALLGLLYLIGTRKGHHANVRELWTADGTGIQILRACMSYDRFLFLFRCIRFDDLQTRPGRRQTDKLAPIRTILDIFVKNCQQCYNTSEFTTTDEMLNPFWGWFIYSGHAEQTCQVWSQNICIMWCKDFLLQQPGDLLWKTAARTLRREKHSYWFVKRLVSPIENSNKNVTTDIWYTHIPLLHYLLEKRTALLGTIEEK